MSKTLDILGELNIYPSVPQEKSPAVTEFLVDKELFIRQAFKDDPTMGMDLLFREYYTPLCSHAVRFVYSRDIARDLVSDIFCTFFQKELYKRVDSSFKAYLYRCVRNDSLKYLQRDLGKICELQFEESNTGIVSTPEDLLRFEELSAKVETVIDGLSPQSQKVFLMNRYEGKKYQEIADELQISLKTVEAHMSKALAKLRKALKSDWLSSLSVLVFLNLPQ